MALNRAAFNDGAFNTESTSLIKSVSVVAALGFSSLAACTVTHPANASAHIYITPYDISMLVETNGKGQALTNISVTGDGTRYAHVDGISSVKIEPNSPDAILYRHMRGEADVVFSQIASMRVDTWGYADPAYLAIASSGAGVRRVPALGTPMLMDIATEGYGSLIHYFTGDSTVRFSSLSKPYAIRFPSYEPVEINFRAIGGAVIPQPAVIRFDAIATGLTIIGFRGSSEVSYSSDASIWLLSDAKGRADIKIDPVFEPAINGVHEATAKSSFGFKVGADDALVRSNAYGLASMKINAEAGAWALLRFAAKSTYTFTAEPIQWNIATLYYGTATLSIHTSDLVTTRTRIYRGHSIIRLRVFEYSTVIRGVSASAAIEVIAVGDGIGYKPMGGSATISVSGDVTGTRVLFPSGGVNVRVNTIRAEMLSNLSQPATRDKHYTVPAYESEFIVPEAQRTFIV